MNELSPLLLLLFSCRFFVQGDLLGTCAITAWSNSDHSPHQTTTWQTPKLYPTPTLNPPDQECTLTLNPNPKSNCSPISNRYIAPYAIQEAKQSVCLCQGSLEIKLSACAHHRQQNFPLPLFKEGTSGNGPSSPVLSVMGKKMGDRGGIKDTTEL